VPAPESRNVISLRRRWKPTKERLVQEGAHEGVRIRIHRACSWMQRVEELEQADAALAAAEAAAYNAARHDDQLILRWIAFNSLYGRWDEERREPQPDFETVRDFVGQLLPLDADRLLGAVLDEHRDLVMAIMEDGYVTKHFWKDPTPEALRKAGNAIYRAQSWYVEGRLSLILTTLLQRIYLLRCQLVHGAASRNGKLNRESVDRCSTMLGHLLPAFLLVIIDHGWKEDWGPLCYPPVR
jgi:hypothetical protein